jgi:hypothetical protein
MYSGAEAYTSAKGRKLSVRTTGMEVEADTHSELSTARTPHGVPSFLLLQRPRGPIPDFFLDTSLWH